MISIHAPIQDSSSLSVKASTLLSWIPGAAQWLQQAIEDQSLSYTFTSEASLISSILSGLYSSELMNVGQSGVVAAPEFLMSLSDDDLHTMALSLPQQDEQPLIDLGNQKHVLTAWHYLQARSVLDTLALTDNPLFLAMNLNDIADLCALNQVLNEQKFAAFVQSSAVQFALANACNVRAFCRLMEFALKVYSFLVKNNSAKRITAAITSKFNALYQDVSAKAMQNLGCPQLHHGQSINDAANVLMQWGAHNRAVGFADMPTAIVNYLNVLGVQALLNNIGNDAVLQQFNQKVVGLTKQPQLTNKHLTQDGKLWLIEIGSSMTNQAQSSSTAEFIVSEDGCIALERLNSSH